MVYRRLQCVPASGEISLSDLETMLDKAIIIGNEVMDFLRSRFPADDAKYGELHRACADMTLRLNWLKGELLDVEHDHKSRFATPCNCSRCDDTVKADKDLLEQCVKDAVREDISEIKPLRVKTLTDKMRLVYDKDKKVDTTDEDCPCGTCEESNTNTIVMTT